jgi:hypothetical protein
VNNSCKKQGQREIGRCVLTQSPDAGRGRDAKGVIFNFGFLMFDYRRVRMWESENVGKSF